MRLTAIPLLVALALPVAGRAEAQRPRRGAARPTARPTAAPPLTPTEPTSGGALARDLGALIQRATTDGDWGVMVVSLTRGDTLYARRPDDSFLPASTLKLYTAAMALERFGPAHEFRTEVLRAGEFVDGTVFGDLYLKGAGDPSLSQRSAGWNGGIVPMDAIAAQVRAAGVRRVTGDVVGDASAFRDRRVPDGWRTRYLQATYAARVSALSMDENLAYLVVRPVGRRATLRLDAPLPGIQIRSSVTVRSGSRGAMLRVWQDTTADVFRVSGWIGSRSPERRVHVVVEQPERFVAASFRAALERQGITVDGGVRMAAAPDMAQPVTSWASAPVAQLVVTINGESNNHFSELLFRNASRVGGASGSAAAANDSLRAFLARRVGVAREAVHAADGSGLSTLNRVTPRSMIQLLAYTRTAPWGQFFESTLPVAGRTGTLRGRMRGTAAEGNLRAKTGSTGEVSSLGGYVTARNGEVRAFSFLYNGGELPRARSAIDAMGATLAALTR